MLRALEHLLQRMVPRPRAAQRGGGACEGTGAAGTRPAGRGAGRWPAAVRADGRPRATWPLNAYERRIVHMAVAEEPGLRTFSVGEGADRRVTIAPLPAGRPARPEGAAAAATGGRSLARWGCADPAPSTRSRATWTCWRPGAAGQPHRRAHARRAGGGAGGAGAAGAARCWCPGRPAGRGLRQRVPGLVLALLRPRPARHPAGAAARSAGPSCARRPGPRAAADVEVRPGAARRTTPGPPAATVTVRALALPLTRPGARWSRRAGGCWCSGRPPGRGPGLAPGSRPGRPAGFAREATAAECSTWNGRRTPGRARRCSTGNIGPRRRPCYPPALTGWAPWAGSSQWPTRRAASARPPPPSTWRPAWPRRSAGSWRWTPTPRAT